jgi:hypothetical protein
MPWIEQLYGDHGVQVSIQVHILPERCGLNPTVEVELFRVVNGPKIEVIRRDTQVLLTEDVGHAEALALRMLSRGLLDLENEKERAERQTELWPR